MLILFLGAGVFFTIRTKGLQFRLFKKILLAPFSGQGGGGLSAFSALSGALAGTLGIGNIVGVAGALLLGGPGSVFWMLLSAFLCMILKYAETLLAMHHRQKTKSGWRGGPMYYMRDALGIPSLAAVFSVLCIGAALLGAGNVTQIGTVADTLFGTFSVPPILTSVVCAILVFWMTGGGEGRLGKLFSLLTPLMSVVFLGGCLTIIFNRLEAVPDVLRLIVTEAFSPTTAVAGVGGWGLSQALKYGVARGVFSNEAGLGSSPIIHAASGNAPESQALCGCFEVFFDTVVMAGTTALAILLAGVPLEGSATALCSAAAATLGAWGPAALSIMIALFAISSVPCWYFYGERCVEYLGGGRRQLVYRVVFLSLTALCPLLSFEGIWALADSLNGLMAVPNLMAVLLLYKQVE